jgi:hypothetical protein
MTPMPAPRISSASLPLDSIRTRVTAAWADVGCSRMALLLAGLNVLTLVVAIVLFSASGFSLGLETKRTWAEFLVLVPAFAIWAHYAAVPGPARDWIIPQAAMVFMLLQVAGVLTAPTQYAAAALNRPTIDPVLAEADSWLGVSVPALTAWTAGHPWLVAVLHWAYFTLLYQLFLPVVVLTWWDDREALWEFAFHMILSGLVIISVFAFWPAACVFNELGFDSLIDQTRFITHFAALRDGSMTVVPWEDIEGLVSVPSFHMVGAVLVTWACRRTWLLWLLLPINVLLVAATVLLGVHYFVDLVASGLLLTGSLALYRWVRRLPGMAPTACGR